MQLVFINNDGAGFADKIDVEDGITVGQLFGQRMPHGKAENYLIRVNRQPTTSDYVLQSGDRVSITPTKIEGASVCMSRRRAPRCIFHLKGATWQPDSGSTVCI